MEGGGPEPPAAAPASEAPTLTATPIGSIQSGQTRITIRARVFSKSTFQDKTSCGGCLECGDKTASVWLHVGPRMGDVEINSAYTFTDLQTEEVELYKRDRFRHRTTKLDFDLKLTGTSSIIKFDSSPYREYKFTEIETLRSFIRGAVARKRDLGMHDVAGVCINVGDKLTERMTYEDGTESDEPVIKLTIVDKSTGPSEGFPLAVIGQPADELDAINISPPFFVAVKKGRLKTFDGGRINSGVTNMITIPQLCTLHNPYLQPKEDDLMTWYDKVTNQKEEGTEEKKRKRDNSAAEGDVVTPVKKEKPDEYSTVKKESSDE